MNSIFSSNGHHNPGLIIPLIPLALSLSLDLNLLRNLVMVSTWRSWSAGHNFGKEYKYEAVPIL